MERVAVSEFRANLLGFLKRVERGEGITLTSRGREVARIMPPENKRDVARAALEELRKKAAVGDVLAPVGEEWEAMK
ncbi:MAG: type II toxin-antitoxin system prevent-host-death family antitoxin [Chlorobaculum sp.]|jgi:prevent-host-death family protein|nr:type II toxin-antitoxin system prevent-host-death family antitoxin [Chlorobaculum sp.]